MLIDSHAHLNFKAFNDDWDQTLKRALDQGTWVINVGSQFITSKKAINIAQDYKEGVYASVGFHPIHAKGGSIEHEADDEEWEFFDYHKMLDLSKHEKVVALGETGLDYYRVKDHKNKKRQKQIFIDHLKICREVNKPVIIHCRDISVSYKDYPEEERENAYLDILEILKDYPDVRGVIHCFGGKLSTAQKFIDAGFYIGFTGIITFKKKAEELQEVVKQLPLEKILVETDCPYLAPEPYRGKQNEPSYVKHITEKIAELKGLSFEQVADQTTQNAKNLFSI